MELNLSVGKILLLTYVVIASGQCINLFSHGLAKTIKENRFVQHLILLLLIMSLVIIFASPNNSSLTNSGPLNILIMTLLIYIWFILTTKLDATWSIGIIILLAIYFLIENKYTFDTNVILNDKVVNTESKLNELHKFIENNNYMLIGIFGITLLGTLFYSAEKQVQYGGGFDAVKFWFN